MKTYRALVEGEKRKVEKGLKREEELLQYNKYIKDNLFHYLKNVDEQKRWEAFEKKKELKSAIANAERNIEESTFSVNGMKEQLKKGVVMKEEKKDENK